MNTGIFYLYEYNNAQKLRNVGFLKIARHYHSCTLQFHARGIPVSCTDILKLCAFYLENGIAKAAILAEISCASHAVSARLNTAESQFPDGRPLPHIDGFLLPLPGGTILAASASDAGFDTRRIQFVPSRAESADPPSRTTSDPSVSATAQTPSAPAASETAQKTSLSPETPETASSPLKATETDSTSPSSKTSETEDTSLSSSTTETEDTPLSSTAPGTEDTFLSSIATETEDTSLSSSTTGTEDTSLSSITPGTEDTSLSSITPGTDSTPSSSTATETEDTPFRLSEPEESLHAAEQNLDLDDTGEKLALLKKQQHDTAHASPENAPMENRFDSSATRSVSQKNVRKIQRSGLTILPRKYWSLAGNSFLMHGYHNYNHLLLVEEDGHYWLGVPGIYDARESRAAELFGFPQFTDSYNETLDLSEDECSTSGTFGYWCRYLK